MLKKTITFTDFQGDQAQEVHYFNLSKAEIIELEMGAEGNSLKEYADKLSSEKDGKKIIALFKEILAKSYGKRSDDGRRFLKSPKIWEEFESSEACQELLFELYTNPAEGAKFMAGLLPQEFQDKAASAGLSLEEIALARMEGKETVTDEEFSKLVRQQSEANMQGFKKPQQTLEKKEAPEKELVADDAKGTTLIDVNSTRPGPVADLNSLTNEELQAILKARGLDGNGLSA